MTNQQIIFNEAISLMEAGVIGTTGREFTYETEDGEKITVKEPEPLHTFAKWKELGRQVKKGEHAKAAFAIWKQGKAYAKKNEDGTEEENFLAKMANDYLDYFTQISGKKFHIYGYDCGDESVKELEGEYGVYCWDGFVVFVKH